jgi:hypothetical protein
VSRLVGWYRILLVRFPLLGLEVRVHEVGPVERRTAYWSESVAGDDVTRLTL